MPVSRTRTLNILEGYYYDCKKGGRFKPGGLIARFEREGGGGGKSFERFGMFSKVVDLF